MRIFSHLYDKVISWAGHRHAQWYLAALSFAESSFFPIPPDVMLAPMCLAERRSAWKFAAITTLMSVVGGVFGYLIGFYMIDMIEPWIHTAGYWPDYLRVHDWFSRWGIWAVFIAGFSPIPYKVFTIAAGAVVLNFPGFLIASFIGRASRFFLVAGILFVGGDQLQASLKRYVDRLGWLVVAIAVVVFAYFKIQG